MLPAILETHLPLNLVIFMLGTTDAKEMMGNSAKEITSWMQQLVHTTKQFKTLDWTSSPEILIIVPPVVKEDTELGQLLFRWATEKTRALREHYQQLAMEEKIHFLDPNDQIQGDQSEGIHLDANNHYILADLIKEMNV